MNMSRGPVLLGGGIGLVLAVLILASPRAGRPLPQARPPTGWILSDCDGPIRELVIQYVPSGAAVVSPVYKQFLAYLPADVKVHVVCPDQAAFDDLRGRVGPVACKLSPVLTGHPMTSWARDRWLALSPPGPDLPVTLLCPRGEQGAESWPARAGDRRIGSDLAAALGPAAVSRESTLYFDGGDFVADDRTTFVAPSVVIRNVQHTVKDRLELLETLRRALGTAVVLLEMAPPHHAGMYMMPIGDRTVIVGDPGLARRAMPDTMPPDALSGCADFTPETQLLFDAVAERCAANNYRVMRIPIIPGLDGRTYITYLNVIIDRRDGKRIVYMPVYRGHEALNAAAAAVWAGAGCEVRPVDCTSAYTHFGSLRCLVNVVRR